MKPLDKSAAAWVQNALKSMSVEEAAGQLLMPEDRNYKPEEWASFVKDAPLGCVFLSERGTERERTLASIEAIKKVAKLPVIVAADMESGLSDPEKGFSFPFNMALGAAGDAELARQKGYFTARLARSSGMHWLFQPVIDLNLNHLNSETNVRSFGDAWKPVAKLSTALIEGLQSGGVVATAKHFPGAGADDRDQHLCTSLNPLPMKKWMATYGKVWRSAIEAGVLSVMPGHISLPDFEGKAKCPAKALPATLNPLLLKKLLRDELGFDGVIVSDAAPMVGITSRCRNEDCAVEFLRAGGDVYLFAHPVEDYRRMLAALKTGYLPEERVWESARRVLELKARLGLHEESATTLPLSKDETERVELVATKIAEASATAVKNPSFLPLELKKGDKVLTVTIKWEKTKIKLDSIDEELKKLGCEVDHLENPSHNDLQGVTEKYKYVFVNVIVLPHALIGNIRLIGPMALTFWRAFYANAKNCVFTSFGSPYLLYDQPNWSNLLALYSPCEASQRAAVGVWSGRVKAKGKLPVKLPKQCFDA